MASFAVNLQEVPYLHVDVCPHLFPQRRYGLVQNLVHRPIETLDLLIREPGTFAKRIDPRPPADLVGVGVANAGHEALPGQDALDLTPILAQPLSENIQGQVRIKCLGPQVAETRHLGQIVGQVDLAHAPGVGVAQVHAVGQAQNHEGLAQTALPSRRIVQPPSQHGVDDQVIAGIQSQNERLASPADLLNPLSREAGGEIASRQVAHHDGPHYFDLGYFPANDVSLQKLFDDLQVW